MHRIGLSQDFATLDTARPTPDPSRFPSGPSAVRALLCVGAACAHHLLDSKPDSESLDRNLQQEWKLQSAPLPSASQMRYAHHQLQVMVVFANR